MLISYPSFKRAGDFDGLFRFRIEKGELRDCLSFFAFQTSEPFFHKIRLFFRDCVIFIALRANL